MWAIWMPDEFGRAQNRNLEWENCLTNLWIKGSYRKIVSGHEKTGNWEGIRWTKRYLREFQNDWNNPQ